MTLGFNSAVNPEVEAIQNHYEKTGSVNVAYAFTLELREVLRRVASTPRRFAVRYRNVRRANLPKFPYHVLFRILEDEIRILAVLHHRRHPARASRRR